MKNILEKKMPVDKAPERDIERHAIPSEKELEVKEKDFSTVNININTTNQLQKSAVTDEDIIMIESILSEDVLDIYNELSESRKKAFKYQGEATALKIKKILCQAKVKADEVFELIKKWLKTLPGINNYFLEQEAKIKTDKILALKKEGQIIDK